MDVKYSVDICRKLIEKFEASQLYRPRRVSGYEPGTDLVYNVKAVESGNTGRVHLMVEKFVGGGFAGQVYRVKVTNIECIEGGIAGVEVGGVYAIKILIPPTTFSRLFRDTLYWIGFQGSFQLQVNPTAARAGALWQKFIRRAAKIRFGDEDSVVDIYATFIDHKLGSCGELSQWVDGRTWRLEVDENMDSLKLWRRGKKIDAEKLGSPEYRAKKEFMADFVKLLHEMGGCEFARQYEWSTCKSQPNCLKKTGTDDNPSANLTAVDFRAGLALLPFLPMSPGDFVLIWKGLKRGSLVQFDRGDLDKLTAFVNANRDDFADMSGMLEKLKNAEHIYRNSVPDITHNHVRLLYSAGLWNSILDSARTGWRVRNLIDDKGRQRLESSKVTTIIFFIAGIIPLFGRFCRKIWGRADWRKHYSRLLTNPCYLGRAIQGKIIEKVIDWHKAGRINDSDAIMVADSVWLYLCHLPFSVLPVGLHKFLTDWQFMKERLAFFTVRPVRLYFNSKLRQQWFMDMVTEGKKKHILTDEDAEIICLQVKEPYIQKYLKSLAVHVCTLPVTQIVSVIVSWIYVRTHPGLSKPEATLAVAGILLLFQITPISPGSLVRGFYVLYLVIKERNFKDYNIAVFLGFFKYIGYLAFPIQMAYHYPALARFMASHWATEAVHIVPVFGERGALLEHWVFCLFYNWPLTIRRRMRRRADIRAKIKPRYWHIGLFALAAAAVLAIADIAFTAAIDILPSGRDIWWLWLLIPLICGAGITLYSGGAVLWKRIISGTFCGIAAAVLYTAISIAIAEQMSASKIVEAGIWRVFVFAVLSTIGVIITELILAEPDFD